jgi:hypothetical protein
MKKPHKFFDVFLDNDLQELENYLMGIAEQAFSKNIFRIPENNFKLFSKTEGYMTQMGIDYYNVFSFPYLPIYKLHKSIKKLTKEACDYYEIDYYKQKYVIHGWVNIDHRDGPNDPLMSLSHKKHFHDHSNGLGAPWFHGYYCVKAEPSVTHYKIDKDENKIFPNINKNNRAILSETGHPHGRASWFQDAPRITIAYDVTPIHNLIGSRTDKWIPL